MRPRTSRAKAKVDMGIDRKKKHDLKSIADDGGVGRVLYVFEKESRARI
jgi:hypothetical protein